MKQGNEIRKLDPKEFFEEPRPGEDPKRRQQIVQLAKYEEKVNQPKPEPAPVSIPNNETTTETQSQVSRRK